MTYAEEKDVKDNAFLNFLRSKSYLHSLPLYLIKLVFNS